MRYWGIAMLLLAALFSFPLTVAPADAQACSSAKWNNCPHPVYSGTQVATKYQLACLGVDDTAIVQQALADVANGYSAQLAGTCAVQEGLSPVTMNGGNATLSGNGTTVLNIANGNNGPAFTLENSARLTVQGLSIIRTQTSPAQGQTGLSITAVPGSGGVYPGSITLRDLNINGPVPLASGWSTGISLNQTAQVLVINSIIQAPNAGTTDNGDSGIAVFGGAASTNGSVFSVNIQLQNSLIQGFSVGERITGYVQGITDGNDNIIGNWRGISWNGIGPNNPQTTSAATSSGTSLQFAAGSLSTVFAGDLVNGTNIPANSRVNLVNNSTGVVVINANVTGGGVGLGETVTFNRNFLAEFLVSSNIAFNAYDHDIYCSFCSLVTVQGSEFDDFGGNPAWVAIGLNETNNNVITGNTILASGTPNFGNTVGIEVSSAIPGGNGSSSITGNNIINPLNCVWLQGTTNYQSVTGNSFQGCTVATVEDSPQNNQIAANMATGSFAPDITNKGSVMLFSAGGTSAGSYVFNGPQLTLLANSVAAPVILSFDSLAGESSALNFNKATNSGPLSRWIVSGIDGSAESGGDTGSNFVINRVHDNGTLNDAPISISRSTGVVTIADGLAAGASAGATCSGSPTSSFASVGGIVTHC